MRKPERLKAYKANDPLATINHVRRILEECGLFTIEDHIIFKIPKLSCCRVYLGDRDLIDLHIGTNGKGMTPRYALASAYGEMMERLQNSALFPVRQLKFSVRDQSIDSKLEETLREKNIPRSFQFAPDEQYLNPEELLHECADVLAECFEIQDRKKLEKFILEAYYDMETACVPFYAVDEGRVRMLSIKSIWNKCGTNGMCAGNTPREAMIQGISELFERYAIRCIYRQRITPPTIPAESFAGTEIAERLRSLGTQGIFATVKDCSLGIGLPVIGLLLERSDGTYTFHLGADPSPITALERCLTELFQGKPKDNERRYFRRDEAASRREDDFYWQLQYYGQIESGFGAWPESIFHEKASYPFSGFEHPLSESDSDDLAYLLQKISQIGRRLFVRDVSFLGFPSYQMYIPGISETDFLFDETKKDYLAWMRLVRCQRTLMNLPESEAADFQELSAVLSELENMNLPVPPIPVRWLVSHVHDPLYDYDSGLLFAQIYGCGGLYEIAARKMSEFLKTDKAQKGPILYFKALGEFYNARANGQSLNQIEADLLERYAKGVVTKVIWAENPAVVFGGGGFPTCFNCSNCTIRNDCRYFDVLGMLLPVHGLYTDNLPDQQALSQIFGENA